MKNFTPLQSKRINSKNTIFLLCLLGSLMLPMLSFAQVISVNSLPELLPYLDDDNVEVKVAPATYTITAADIQNGTYGTPRFVFSGDSSTYDFTGVTINFAADVYTSGYSMSHIQITGNHNVLKNLKMEDMCSKYGTQVEGGVNVIMDGQYNRVEGFHITTRGSYPYGYGDCFGKGGTYTIKHWKHSAFLIRGDYNHALNDTIYHYSYGHCMFMQAASHPTIEGCYLEGETRTTDEMLAEEGTGTAADLIDFYTVWGYRLPSGYTKSTGEAGIRAYNAGTTYINGEEIERGTNDPTILNCYVKDLRVGVTLTHATGTKYVEGVTAIGTERGFAIGSGDIVDCYADAQHGPVFGVDYDSDKNCNAEITVLPYEGETYNGSKYLAYIRGSNHNITLKSAVDNPDQDLKIEFGGDSRTVGQLAEIENYLAKNVTLNNYTNYPVILNENSDSNTGTSGGMVSDFGTNNSITHTAVSTGKYEAEDYLSAADVSTEITTDDGAGLNLTSIEAGDYMTYEIDVPYSGTYSFDYRVASASVDGDFTLSVDGQTLETITFTATGGEQSWTTISSATPVALEKGTQTLKIAANTSGWKMNWFDMVLECAKVEVEPYLEVYNSIGKIVSTESLYDIEVFPGNAVSFQPEPSIGGTWSWTGPNGFTANTRVIDINDVDANDAGDYIAIITNDCGQESTDTFSLTIGGTQQIEAESYSSNSGVTTETTSDTDGGENVTSIDVNDWMEYTFDVIVPATYAIDFRVASATAGDFSFSIDGVDVEQVTFSATGGVQTWVSTSSTEVVYLEEGTHTLKITSNSAGWNINWFKLSGQDYVSPCILPLQEEGIRVQNETVSWTTGLMDISCASSVNVYVELSDTGALTLSDSLNIYYSLDGGEFIEISKNTGSLSETLNTITGLSATTLEVIIKGASSSEENFYTVEKLSIVESTDPFARIEAEDFESKDAAIATSDTRLGSIEPGGWSLYTGLDLTGAISIDASVGTSNSDAYIEVRLGAIDGTLIGTIEVPNTGNYNTYSTASTYIDEVTGIYDVYLVYQTVTSASVCNIDWFAFSDAFVKRPTDPYERFEAEINDGESGTAVLATTDVDGDDEVGDLQNDDYIMFSALNLEEAASIKARVSSSVSGVIEVRVGSAVKGEIIAFIDVPNTGSSNTWETVSATVDYVEGENDIYFVFKGDEGDLFQVNWLQFMKVTEGFSKLEVEDYTSAAEDVRASSTSTDDADDGEGEIISYMKPDYWVSFTDVDLSNAESVYTRYATNYDDVSVEVRIDSLDGELIGTIELASSGGWSDWATASANLSSVSGVHDVYFVYQTESSNYACHSNWFQFSAYEIPESIDTQNRIEFEDYDRADGPVISATTDVDGVEELGSITDDNWILFRNIDLTDMTNIDVRYATATDGVRLDIRLGSYNGDLMGFISLPNTNSEWATFNYSLLGSAEGLQDVYFISQGEGDDLFQLNWFQFQPETSAVSKNAFVNTISLYPNPVSGELTITEAAGATIELYNMLGRIISRSTITSNKQTIDFSQLTEGYYLLKATKIDGKTETLKVIKN